MNEYRCSKCKKEIEWDPVRVGDGYVTQCCVAVPERIPHNLPPDPQLLNEKRSDWAHTAIRQFMRSTGCDKEDAVGDLICDLMHWCDRNDTDFEFMLMRARGHYEEETLGEPESSIL